MKRIYLLAAATIALAACTNDNNYTDIDEPATAAQITATIDGCTLSRASDDKWAKDDTIGVTMGTKYLNIKYTTESGDGMFTGTTMYFNNKKDPVTLTAYYPFTGDEGSAPGNEGIIAANTSLGNQTTEKQPGIDFLYAREDNVKGSNPKVKFTFSHQMSKLTLKFINGNGADVSKITSCQIEGLILDGTFNTQTGVCAANSSVTAETISMDLSDVDVKSGVALPSLIVFPQAADDKSVTLRITDGDNQEYACTLGFDNNRIESGNNYQFTVKVNKTGLSVENPEITNWNNNESQTETGSVLPVQP